MKSRRLATAAHILSLLEFEGGRPVCSDYIAGSVNTNPVVVRRLLAAMGRARLVVAQPGVGGGSQLARPAHTITLRDVYDAVEDGPTFTLHDDPNARCPVGKYVHEALLTPLDAATEAVRASLAAVTIADLVKSIVGRAGERHTPNH